MGMTFRLCCLLCVLCPGFCAFGASSTYTGVAPFAATEILTGAFNGFDVTTSGKIVGVEGNDINLYSAAGVFERTIATVPDYQGWGAFCRLSPDESQVWAGFTVLGNDDDRIYTAPFAGGDVTHLATLAGNYDLEWGMVGKQIRPFVSGLNSTSWTAPNSVWLLDTSGADNHLKVAEVGGYGSGIAFDSQGNLYAMNQVEKWLYRFAAQDVQDACDGLVGCLLPADAGFSTEMAAGGSDITVDGADHVFFNANGSTFVGLLRPEYPGSFKYDDVALGTGEYGNWSTQIAFGGGTGDVLLGGGAIYVSDYFSTGVTMFTVPEPAGLLTLSTGLTALAAALRRRMK